MTPPVRCKKCKTVVGVRRILESGMKCPSCGEFDLEKIPEEELAEMLKQIQDYGVNPVSAEEWEGKVCSVCGAEATAKHSSINTQTKEKVVTWFCEKHMITRLKKEMKEDATPERAEVSDLHP
jgi:phage FluMu protein Com